MASRSWNAPPYVRSTCGPDVSGLAAAIYTQLADVEIEVNGYLTYDRAKAKMDERRIAKVHRALCRALG